MSLEQIEDIYALSPLQQGFLFHTLYAPQAGVYFEQFVWSLRGALDGAAFARAWQQIVDHHPVLRTSFHWEDLEAPAQVVHRQATLPLERLDWRDLDGAALEARLERYLEADRQRGFDLTEPPLMRLTLIQLADDTFYLLWSCHHLLLDGWSIALVLRDVFRLYEAARHGQALRLAPARPYGDYIEWLQQQDQAAAEAFWRATLKGFRAPTPLIGGPPPGAPDTAPTFDEQQAQLSTEATAGLRALARQHQLTLNTLFLGAWALLLSQYSGEDDIVFGATVSGRPADLDGFETMVGLFINTLPVRVSIDRAMALPVWLKHLQERQFELRRYEYSALMEVQSWSEVPRNPGVGKGGLPLFESIVVFENYPIDRSLGELAGSLAVEHVYSHQQANYPLAIMAIPAAELHLRISYDAQRFDADTIARMLGHLQTILQGMAAQPERRLGALPILTPAEQQALLAWPAPQPDSPGDTLIHDLFAAQAARTPDSIALMFDHQEPRTKNQEPRTKNQEPRTDGDATRNTQHATRNTQHATRNTQQFSQFSILNSQFSYVTYAELNARANQLAHHLQALGVGPEVPVALCAERSADFVVGILGILKAGGVYVPLDPGYPPDRLRYMLEDAQVSVLLTDREIGDWRLESDAAQQSPISNLQSQIIDLDADRDLIATRSTEPPPSRVTGANLAYMIYTSGTTGRPKAVMVEHRNLANSMRAAQAHFELGAGDRVPCIAAFSFDISLFELLSPLLVGGTAVLITREQVLDLPRLAAIVRAVSFLHALPSLMRQLVGFLASGVGRGACSNIRQVFVGGDAVPPDLLREMQAVFPAAQLFIAYGPTEAAMICALYRVPAAGPPQKHLVGAAMANTGLRIYDRHGNLAPIGVAGELYIGGASVARGYRNRPGLTAERFIPNPFAQGGLEIGDWRLTASTISNLQSPISNRLYRTGDLCRSLPDGTIEFLGRIDDQVKLRGFRIELGEIEALLGAHGAVRAAVVLAREDTPGEKRLVAYVVSGDWRLEIGDSASHNLQSPISNLQKELRQFLRDRLPDYMVPSAFVFLEMLPLTPNGKIDRAALPAPEAQRQQDGANPPRSALERTIAAVWQEVLQIERVGVHENFFDLGGHSLRMMQVHGKLRQALDRDIAMVDLFRHPTVAALATALGAEDQPAQPQRGRPPLRERVPALETDIAIVGMAGRFPGAPNLDAFWRNLRDGVESISFFSDEELLAAGVEAAALNDPGYVKAGAVLDGIEDFDAAFFGYTPIEATVMDPQQRFFMECAWEALEHAGYNPEAYAGRIGIYGGVSTNSYLLFNLAANPALIGQLGGYQTMLLNERDHLTTRVSYKLNLRGPSVNIQTACSTSLVAAVFACQHLILHQCDMALAGGVSISVPHRAGYRYQEGGISSPDGHCRAFDAAAQGTIAGNGVGIVVLKRLTDALADGDTIHAVIKGFATNNDGAHKVGYTAPSVDGQAEVIAEALALGGIAPETIGYVEAHGTATPLGDPIEIAALRRAFGSAAGATCAIGSVKTNIGHLDAAAGVTGLIKTVMALKHAQLPPSLHFQTPNPQINFADTPFYVNTNLTEWNTNGAPRRAGVSAFGIGGTNAHLVLEEAPESMPTPATRPWHLLVLSARTGAALERAALTLSAYLRAYPDLGLADVAYTLQAGRKALGQRMALVCQDSDDAADALETQDPQRVLMQPAERSDRPVVFLFPGQGAQYVQMAQDLYQEEPLFREQIDRCAELLRPHLGLDLRAVLYPAPEQVIEANRQLQQTWLTQPALFAVEYALAQLWMSWGVRPQALLGHSIGEYVAACLASVFSLEDALALVALRGRLIQELPTGAMLSVPLSEAEMRPLLGPDLALAAVNAPTLCVVSGPAEAVARLEQRLAASEIASRRLHTSHAFHSAMMDPILERFAEEVSQLTLRPPAIPYLSNVTGTWITAGEATDPRYWAWHLRQTVRFNDSITELLSEPERIMLEVGPGRMLSTLVQQHRHAAVIASLRHPHDEQSDVAFLLGGLGRLWLAGAPVAWERLYAGDRRRRLPLPTYPFERRRYWIEGAAGRSFGAQLQDGTGAPANGDGDGHAFERHARPELPTIYVAPRNQIEEQVAAIWQELLGVEPIGVHDDFFALGGHSLMATRLGSRLREVFPVELSVRELFEVPSVAQLAELIEVKLVEKLDELSEEEIRHLI